MNQNPVDHTPVIAPLADDDVNRRQADLLASFKESGRDFNVFRTMAQHPDAMEAFLTWGSYILSDRNTLPARHRELVILRTGAVRDCAYEFLRHAIIARRIGLDDQAITAIFHGDYGGFNEAERLCLGAADELLEDGLVHRDTFKVLEEAFGLSSAIDLVWTVGQYAQVCMFLKTAETPPDPDIADDKLAGLFA